MAIYASLRGPQAGAATLVGECAARASPARYNGGVSSLLDRYLASIPTDEETARRAVRPYAGMSGEERLRALADLLGEMDILLGGRLPIRSPDDEQFWRHWKDPTHGSAD